MRLLEKDILYEDESVIVCHKRPGMAVQSARPGQMDMESALKNRIALAHPEKGIPYLGIVQRLDQPVEGLLVFARTPKAAAALNRQLTQGQIGKEYLAVVESEGEGQGTVLCPLPQGMGQRTVPCPAPARELTNWLKKEGSQSVVVQPGTPGGKKARLAYEVLAETGQERLLRVKLYTGRFHQIRCQLAHAGMPIAGDVRYGAKKRGQSGIGLCSCRLSFTHPVTGKKMEYSLWPEGEAFQHFSPSVLDRLEV